MNTPASESSKYTRYAYYIIDQILDAEPDGITIGAIRIERPTSKNPIVGFELRKPHPDGRLMAFSQFIPVDKAQRCLTELIELKMEEAMVCFQEMEMDAA